MIVADALSRIDSVKLSDVHFSYYGKTEVIKGVSMDIKSGQTVALVGPSGGGKSTLLRCCTLLETLDSGSLSYGDIQVAQDKDGKSVYASKDTLRAARQKFGLVFQNFNLFPHYTVLKNIMDAPIAMTFLSRQAICGITGISN